MEAWISHYGDFAVIALILMPLLLIVRLLGESVESPEAAEKALPTRKGAFRAATISACFAMAWCVMFGMTWQDEDRGWIALAACGVAASGYLMLALQQAWKARKLAA